jgi:hypothetical protein
MNGIPPVVRYFILCEEIRPDTENPDRWALVGVLSTIRPRQQPAYPFELRRLGIFVQLAECRGDAEFHLVVRQEENGAVLDQTEGIRVSFRHDPLAVASMRFRLPPCRFPVAGLYWVELWYNQTLLARQPLVMR